MENTTFGGALRQWRDAVAPADAGVPTGARRRASGLRREELAAAAGISVDYLTRLEQGRSTAPSVQVLEALARGLRLRDADRELMFRLAGQAVPGPGLVSGRIPASVTRLLERFEGHPFAVFDAMWNLVSANAAYEAVMGLTDEGNAIVRHVMDVPTRVVQTPAEFDVVTSGLIEDLRLTVARYPDDPRVARLVKQLSEVPRFAQQWTAAPRAIADERGRSKVVDVPGVGPITLDCDVLYVTSDDLRVMIYSAEPRTSDAERLQLALVVGVQALMS